MSDTPIQTDALAKLRTRIDGLDAQLLALLNERAQVAEEVGQLKRQEGTPFFRPDRVAQVIAKVQRTNPGPLLNQHVAAIWREIMSACLALEVPQRVAVLGPEGTFTEQAAVEYFGSAANLVYCQSFDEVFKATAAGTAQFGVVAVENSTEGFVARTFDLFLHSPVHIVGEVSLLVRHNLLRQSASLEGIEAVLAHPQALMQCHGWLSQHLPDVERRAVSSNAEGARLAAGNPAWASLASERAAAQFGLHIAAHAIQDEAYNRTRFAVICLPQTMAMPAATGRDCTSIVVSVPNKPGSVHDMLTPLKKHGASMTRFESRPAKSGQWEYFFYIDIAGHPSEPHIHAALEELRTLCAFYKVLGAYPWDKMFEQLGLIGCGLMGGSFALAAKRAGLVRRVVGYSKSPSTTERARQLGVIDVEAPSALLAASGADLVLLAVPVAATEATFKAIRHLLTPQVLVIDVGSTKRDVVDAARRTLRSSLGSFVPCHPITGREVAGVENADPNLYAGKQVILTPLERTLTLKIEQADALWRALGCRVTHMSAQAHDEAFAAVSHLPHLIAFALMNSIVHQPRGKEYLALAGPGFRDFSRIAAADPQVWRDVLTANREELGEQVQHFQAALSTLEKLIASNQIDALEQLITQASHARATWRMTPEAK